ncbi:MAG: hypothetical protein PUP93_34085, partial [Rhizonema sp. NSF051]|nr:hypothetical protein [Rhizonema sp. NSF051]
LKLCKYILVGVLLIGGAIASSGGYAFAQSWCLEGQSCAPPIILRHPQPGDRGIPQGVLEDLQQSNPQAIRHLQQEDAQALEKLAQFDRQTVNRLEQLVPNSTQRLQMSPP